MSARAVLPLGLTGSLALAGALLAAPTVVLAGDPCYHGFEVPARSSAAGTQIKAMPCAFAPTVAYVPAGATVTFFSGPGDVHLVTGANQEWGSRDEELRPNSTVAYTFDEPGVYPYACALHRGMSGVIVVGDGPAVGAAADRGGAAENASSASGGELAGGPGLALAAAGAGLLAGSALAWAVQRRRFRRSATTGPTADAMTASNSRSAST